jgi:hypothetical protein
VSALTILKTANATEELIQEEDKTMIYIAVAAGMIIAFLII